MLRMTSASTASAATTIWNGQRGSEPVSANKTGFVDYVFWIRGDDDDEIHT